MLHCMNSSEFKRHLLWLVEPFRDLRGFDVYGKIFEMLTNIQYNHFFISDHGKLVQVNSMENLIEQNVIAIPEEKTKTMNLVI